MIGKARPISVTGEVGTGFSNIANTFAGKGRWRALQQQHRLGANRQFNYVYRRGKRVSSRDLSLLVVKNHQKRVGFSVSKKVGVAVVRNRTKRRLRECVRPLLPRMRGGLYVFVARPSAADCSFEQLNAAVHTLLRKADAFIDEGGAKP